MSFDGPVAFVFLAMAACVAVGVLVERLRWRRAWRRAVAAEVARVRAALEVEFERTAEWNFKAGRERGANEMAARCVHAAVRLN